MGIIESFRIYFPIMLIVAFVSGLQILFTGESWATDVVNYLFAIKEK